MSHTLLLLQPTRRPEQRTYCDYESVTQCMEGICKIYEEHLREWNPQSPSITYDIAQLYDFIDNLYDVSCLVYHKASLSYTPHGKEWIKGKVFEILTKQVK